MLNINLLTATTGTTQPGMAEMIPSLLMMVAMIVVFYFMLIRPQKKKDKAVKDMLNALKVSDRVCTIGGIYGTVTGLKDDTVTLAVGAQKTSRVSLKSGTQRYIRLTANTTNLKAMQH